VTPSPTEDLATVDVTMPQMGVSVAEGTVVQWRKQVGDWVQADETICEISTDKIDTEVPAPASGRVAEILVAVEETVPVGTVLARLVAADEPRETAPHDRSGPAATPAPLEAAPSPPPTPPTSTPTPPGTRHYSPVVRRIAAAHSIDLEKVVGTGREGRVRKQDVLAAAAATTGNGARPTDAAPDPPLHTESPYRPESADEPRVPEREGATQTEDVVEPLSRMRRSIAEHMLRSLRTAAHCTTIVEADFLRIERARAALGLTYLPIVARCVIDALREFPMINATLDGDTLTRHRDVNLGIAVSLGEDGLIVPVIHRAQDLSAEGLGQAIADLGRRARARQLTNDEVIGGTFTITNPGAFGAIAATPIINQPQVAILDLEAVVKRPVVVDQSGQDAIAIRPMANLCLSWDHRALDGALAARFLGAVTRNIEGWNGG
jgi:2-oxoglutarate dehydrogenase E2 component (dihydrolipoamide succinyltransferase)